MQPNAGLIFRNHNDGKDLISAASNGIVVEIIAKETVRVRFFVELHSANWSAYPFWMRALA